MLQQHRGDNVEREMTLHLKNAALKVSVGCWQYVRPKAVTSRAEYATFCSMNNSQYIDSNQTNESASTNCCGYTVENIADTHMPI